MENCIIAFSEYHNYNHSRLYGQETELSIQIKNMWLFQQIILFSLPIESFFVFQHSLLHCNSPISPPPRKLSFEKLFKNLYLYT